MEYTLQEIQYVSGQSAKQQRIHTRGKLIAGFAAFLALMWVCTIVSKSIYVSGLAGVRTVEPVDKYIEHMIEAEGVVVGGGEQAICTLAGLRVKQICIKEGDQVHKEDALLVLDAEDMQQQIRKQELEIAKLNAQLNELTFEQVRSQQVKEVEALWEQEDLTLLDASTKQQVERAVRERDEAAAALAKHTGGQTSVTSQEERQKAQASYQSWKQQIADQKTQIARQEVQVEETVLAWESLQAEVASGTVVEEQVLQDAQTNVTQAKQKLAQLKAALSEQENQNLAQPDYTQQDSDYKSWLATKETLEQALQDAEDRLQDAELARQTALKEQVREVANAQVPQTVSSQLEQSRLSLQGMQEQLAVYQNLMKEDGILKAPSDGVITKIAATTGERTTDTAAVLMTQEGVACQFRMTIPIQQKKYIKAGEHMKITFSKDGSEQEAEVVSLSQSENGTEFLDVYLALPQGIGQPQELGSVKKSVQGELRTDCIPIEALHKQDNRYFVYLLQEREGILGVEQYVEELLVHVADQNERFAAIESGILPPQARIITSSSKEIANGDVVVVR